uniref:Sodium/hydrogen exchanger 7 (Trinotate prediction) n=1 Tax=Henneguya salminicola TaxID=69463 RepID=A0A6G3MGC8_HENSL
MALIGTALTMFLFSTLIYIYSFIDTSVKILGLNFAQSLVFGVIVCSTDPVSILSVFTQLGVDVDLYYIILGESALNDAVSLIAQRTVNNYHHQYVENNIPYSASNIFKYLGLFFLTLIGSFTVGTMFALLNAVITKSTQLHRFPIVEAALFLILSYCSFIATEMCGMVGIVGILFCGVFQAHYTRTNLSDESKLFVEKTFDLLCFFFEQFVFSYMGITVFAYSKHVWNIGLLTWAFV